MRNIGLKVAMMAGLAAVALTTIPTGASAMTRQERAEKKAVCKERASHMNFGMHWIKRNRWVKECIAGKHPA